MNDDERIQKLLDVLHSGKSICGTRTNIKIQSTLEHDVRCYWWSAYNHHIRAGLKFDTLMDLVRLHTDWIVL